MWGFLRAQFTPRYPSELFAILFRHSDRLGQREERVSELVVLYPRIEYAELENVISI